MDLEYYKSIVADVFDRKGWGYDVEIIPHGDDSKAYMFTLGLDTGMTGGDVGCYITVHETGNCHIRVFFLDAVCPEERIGEMCYLLTQLNYLEWNLSKIWKMNVESGEVEKYYLVSFGRDSKASDEMLFERKFNEVTDYNKEDLVSILQLCNGSNSSGNAENSSGIKMKF